jgi:hypothetical protein
MVVRRVEEMGHSDSFDSQIVLRADDVILPFCLSSFQYGKKFWLL